MELAVRDLTKKYGKKTALDSFSYTFTPGIYGILGPNGAGKSTLMGLFTDTVKRTSGSIMFNGEEILELGAEFRKKIGYMPQEQGLYDDFTVRRFLNYMAQLKGVVRGDRSSQVEDALIVTNLRRDAHKRIRECSGGMKQRVMVAQALLGQPKVLLLDEPTVGLDPKERIRFCEYIEAAARDRIVLVTTHIVSDIERMAKEILFMKNGKIAAAGTKQELYKRTGLSSIEDIYMHFFE